MDNMVVPTLIDYLYKKVLRPSIIGPAFIYNYPKLMQPLARQSDTQENIVEQFQVLVNGWEILKAYSELVDPKVQQNNFNAQSGAIDLGDEEAISPDNDFVLAMEY
jgi:lysyl-tRNA synthetase class 2